MHERNTSGCGAGWRIALLVAGGLVSLAVAAQAAGDATLSAAQRQRIAQAIGALKSPVERRMAFAWSPAKQVAEVLCRPLARRLLHRRDSSIDKVFLGLGDPGDLVLAGNRLLAGRGQARHAGGWTTFVFTCELDPASGKAVRFTAN